MTSCTIAGIRQWFHGLTSAVVSGNRIHNPNAAVAMVPMPAQTTAVSMLVRVASAPHSALPAASPPCVTSMKIASTRARTQSGAIS